MKVTGGDCHEMLKLLPLGLVNLADPGMVTGGVACETGKEVVMKEPLSSEPEAVITKVPPLIRSQLY